MKLSGFHKGSNISSPAVYSYDSIRVVYGLYSGYVIIILYGLYLDYFSVTYRLYMNIWIIDCITHIIYMCGWIKYIIIYI